MADMKAYEDLGIEEYKYLATLDYATCETCQPLDGKVFKLSEVKEGVNYPVMHPRCRCTTTINIDYSSRRARNPLTGKNEIVNGNLTYEQWIKSLSPEEQQALNQASNRKSQRVADKLDKKLADTQYKRDITKMVDNSAKSDIMKSRSGSGRMELNREVKRRESNIGAFQNLEIPMQKRSVLSVARKYNISTEGLTFKIQRSEKLLALPFYGSTDYDHVGRIDLFPNAFINEEQLVRTIIHEKCHVKQLNKYGKTYAIENLDLMEKQAERFENLYYSILRKRVH